MQVQSIWDVGMRTSSHSLKMATSKPTTVQANSSCRGFLHFWFSIPDDSHPFTVLPQNKRSHKGDPSSFHSYELVDELSYKTVTTYSCNAKCRPRQCLSYLSSLPSPSRYVSDTMCSWLSLAPTGDPDTPTSC